MEIPKWRVTASSYVVTTPFLRLRKDSIELPDGTRIDDYYVREGRGFSVVFALTQEHDVVLVRQFKYGAGRIMLELPGGLIDEDEDPAGAAARELREETGYVAQSIEFVRSFATEPSHSQARMHLYLARGARKVATQRLDPTEAIEVERYPLAVLPTLLASGAVESMGQVAAIYTVLDTLANAGTQGNFRESKPV